jgi:nucleotide-binding universal stress UspA family protein
MDAPSSFTLLVPLDGSKTAEQALGLATTLASPGGTIHLAQVVPMPDTKHYPIRFRDEDEVRKYWQYEAEEARGQLRGVANRWSTSSISIEVHATGGEPTEELLRFAGSTKADMIVMTSHGLGALRRSWFGSVADRIARTASIPVAIVRADSTWTERGVQRYDRVLLPYDGSELAESALPVARAIAERLHVPIHVVRIINPGTELWPAVAGEIPIPGDVYQESLKELETDAQTSVDGLVTKLRAAGVRADGVVLEGLPADALLQMAGSGDLIVLTSHGRSGVRRWLLGSVAEKLVRMAGCPVVLVPAPNRGAPDDESVDSEAAF